MHGLCRVSSKVEKFSKTVPPVEVPALALTSMVYYSDEAPARYKSLSLWNVKVLASMLPSKVNASWPDGSWTFTE